MPPFHRNRTLLAVLAALVGAVIMTLGLPASARPGPAGGSHRHAATHQRAGRRSLTARIGSVNAQLARLSRRSDQLDERYNVAANAVAAQQRVVRRSQRAAAAAAARYQAAHRRFLQAVTQQYEDSTANPVGTLLTSSTPQNYLDNLSLADYLARQFATTVHADQAAHAAAGAAAHRAGVALTAARRGEAALAAQKTTLNRQSRHFQRILDSLTAQQRRQRARALALAAARAKAQLAPAAPTAHRHPAPPASGPVSGDVAKVISFAEAQVGKPYSYGSAGPGSYDCSGLAMASYAQIGISLPHSAAEQYNYGTHVAYSQLQPGDLIFLYHPIGHVEIYVGHDLAVSAANPSEGIVYVHPSQDMADYTGATRLVG
jgi:cell wall-associated NlpC family hydrolase